MKPYRLLRPVGEGIGVLATIPHTGTWLPDDLAERLASDAMRALPMTDWHLHELYDFLPALGVTVLHATVSRFAGDLNRSPTPIVLYPGRFETGTIALETFWGEPVWNDPPDQPEIDALIDRYHRPYHEALTAELDRLRARFGRAVLFDLHSVPSKANRIHDELQDDIYLGTRDANSCGLWLTDAVDHAYREAGFRTAIDAPYKGGFTTHHYGAMDAVDALQVEMVQRVYMDEDRPEGAPRTPVFHDARRRLRAVFERITVTCGSGPLAAK